MASSARIDELRKKFDENPRRYFAPLANEYRKAGDAEQAIFICQEYLPQQPGHMSGHIVYGQALYELNRHDEARAVFETALSLDPENLIALRHLGDIARESGDMDIARVWYQRVLEADPRNEEIAQIMLSLLSSESSEASGAASVAGMGTGVPTPITNPAFATGADSSQSAEAPHVTSDAGASATEQRDDAEHDAHARFLGDPAAAHESTPPSDVRPLSPHAPKEADLLDLDDFDLGGIPLSELRAANPTPIYEPAQPFDESTASGIDLPPMIGSDEAMADAGDLESSDSFDRATTNEGEAAFADEQPEFEADPYAVASASFDNDLGNDDDSLMSQTIESSTEPMPESAALPDESIDGAFRSAFDAAPEPELAVDGLETFEAGVFITAPTTAEFIETESFFETTSAVEPAMAEPAMADEPEAGEAQPALDTAIVPPSGADSSGDVPAEEPAAAPVEAFVTETMAELYLEQGHLESALDIYQRLVDQRPEDPALFTRMQAVQDRIDAAAQMPAEPESDMEVAPARSYGGPTIREFLSGLARKSPGYFGSGDDASYPHAGPADTGVSDPYARDAYAGEDFSAYVGTPAPYDGIDEPFNTDALPVDRAIETPLEEFGQFDELNALDELDAPETDSRSSTTANETVSGSLGALFSGADATASDTAAAKTLSAAFASEGPETAALEGLPAHRASSELSLDHVFKGNTNPRPSGDADGFSFDQFFADEAADGAAETNSDAPPSAAQGADDIAQFNAWLNGLKKT